MWFLRAGTATAVVLAATLSATSSLAAGFYVRSNSTTAMITNFAGSGSYGYDPSNQFYNPATLSDLPGWQVMFDLRGFLPNAEIEVDSATAPDGSDISSLGNSGELTSAAVAPAGYASFQVADDLVMGLSVSSPFVAILDSDPVWAGQYQLLSTDFVTFNGQISAAYRVTDWLAVGGGVNVQYFDFKASNLQDFPTPFGTITSPGTLKGDDTALGFNFGVRIDPHEDVRVGVSYRSRIKHSFQGTASADDPAIPSQGASFALTTPDMATLSVSYDVDEDLTLLADVGWTNWSAFQGFTVRFESPFQPDAVRRVEFRDTWHGALGFRYEIDEGFTVGSGALFDQSAATGGNNTLSPDGHRVEFGAGLNKTITDNISVNLAANHLIVMRSDIDVANAGGTLKGDFHANVTAIGMNVVMKW